MAILFDHPFFERGFRPFFLLGAGYSAASLVIWAGFYAGHIMPPSIFVDPVSWHSHEMIYGFTLAIIAGFLLTAVANWTGGAPVRHAHLAGLCVLWLAGRIVMNFDLGLSLGLVYGLETAFIPALAVSLAVPLLKSRNKRNFIFLGLLAALFACDVFFFVSGNRLSLYIALFVIAAMISLVGGRVIPAFTVAALRQRGEKVVQTDQLKMDIAALVSWAVLALVLVLAGSENVLFGVAAFFSAAAHVLRMRHYYTFRTFNNSMLWILQAGYAWLIAGLLLLGLSGFGFVPFSAALHALTAGAIGSMTLGMMCRVTLGHTGRNITASPMTTIAFVLMIFAGLVRVLGPVLSPGHVSLWIVSSAFLWSLCFSVYILVYAPILWKPGADGRPS